MKKFWILLVAVLLLFTLVGTATAVETTEPEQTEEVVFVPNAALVEEVEQLYKNCLRSANNADPYDDVRTSFKGYCGLMTSYQLCWLGINPQMNSYNGKDQYDAYKDMTVTAKGHTVRAYSVKDYTMEEALNAVCANGKKTVRNILVGFEKTNTTAGQKYGHCLVINVIEGGMIYYTESFGGVLKVPEGKAIVCSIAEFVDYYSDWTRYEGLVYFGEPEYANKCTSYRTDVYVQVRFESVLRSQPCLLEENGCQSLRTLVGGEFLHATGLFESEAGDLFYRVVNGDTVGYISANAVYLLQPEELSASLSGEKVPTTLSVGKKLTVSGSVAVANASVSELILELKDRNDAVCLTVTAEATGASCDLNLLNQALKKANIAEGSYCLTISAKIVSAVADRGEVTEVFVQQELCCQALTVGAAESITLSGGDAVYDGWFEKDGVWYCYKNGAPLSGWIVRVGVKYYLKEDGSLTTGWAVINGVTRYFSPTGAMCLGWITTYEGVHYLYEDGTLATGLQTIDDVTYYFDKDGVLMTWGTVATEGGQYIINENGIATIDEQ